MIKIAAVVISNSTREFDKKYHYALPEEFKGQAEPGMRVIVPFGKSNKAVEATIFELIDSEDEKGLKSIKKILDEKPILNQILLMLAEWMKDTYICTFADAIRCMLPPGIGIKSSCIVRVKKAEQAENTVSIQNESKLSAIQKKILDILNELGGECEKEELKSRVDSKSFIKNLNKLLESDKVNFFEEYARQVNDKKIRVAYINMPFEDIIYEIESNRIKKIQQIRVLEMLLENEYIAIADIIRFSGVSSSVLDTLKKYGYIDFKDIIINRDPLKHRIIQSTEPLKPSKQQAVVLESIKGLLYKEEFKEILLHGVTGSGKTEVYMQLIKNCIDAGKQAIVLVPEISLTPQMVERFKGRFGKYVAVLHSRLSLGERCDQWKLIKSGNIKVAVGARSAVFAPFDRLGLIIIDEEHESTYKSETTPKYHARDIAREICFYSKAILLNGSATPAIETYYRAKNNKILLLEMQERANEAKMPEVHLVDLRRELDEGNRSVFSRRLADEISKNIDAKQQTILFLNRRGYASFVLCRNCGYTVKCVSCNISLTYHSFDERLICHYCGYTIKSPETCPMCKSNYIRHFGTGTQKIEDEIKKQFPGSSVVRMDMDTTSGKNAHEEILTSFREKNINIMVGTQMIAKGHDFPNVTLVGVLAADSLLNMDDYRASERTFQLITQVAGRAGRERLAGRVIIQTYKTEDFSIVAACSHDFISFYNQEIKIREALNYPPFTNIGLIILSSINDRTSFNKSKAIKEKVGEYFSEDNIKADILGPLRAPISKIKNKYRWRIVIKCKDVDKLKVVMGKITDEFYKAKDNNLLDLSVDINPVNML